MRTLGNWIAAILWAIFFTTACACGRGYSEGERTGTITKLSNKGLVWKSWEGEMVLGGMRAGTDGNGNATLGANVWAFTVLDYRLVKPISEAQQAGKPVTVHYVQWLMNGPSRDTDYEVTAVEPVAR
jgi:hypothetical protein